jgi:predicted enzyme related to lactoylglutathione lyase
MQLVSSYKGKGHPDWALLESDSFRLALHAEHRGNPHKISALCINFFAEDIYRTLSQVQEFGGSIKRQPAEVDFRPTQPVRGLIGAFADPDGNEHFLIQETKDFKT